MDAGRLVEAGRHTELIERGGHYAKRVSAQVQRTGGWSKGRVCLQTLNGH